LTVNGDDDTVFVDSVNDATNTLTAPLEDEQVESIHAREMAHMTRDVLMRERVRFYEEHMKAKEESLNAYFTQMNELEYDMKKLGSHIMGPDLALANNKIEIVLTESFIEQMKRATRDDYRAIDDLTSQYQEMDDSFMDYLRETEKVSTKHCSCPSSCPSFCPSSSSSPVPQSLSSPNLNPIHHHFILHRFLPPIQNYPTSLSPFHFTSHPIINLPY
jgi:chromosome segregation ATPase